MQYGNNHRNTVAQANRLTTVQIKTHSRGGLSLSVHHDHLGHRPALDYAAFIVSGVVLDSVEQLLKQVSHRGPGVHVFSFTLPRCPAPSV